MMNLNFSRLTDIEIQEPICVLWMLIRPIANLMFMFSKIPHILAFQKHYLGHFL